MNENKITLWFAVTAAVLVVIALLLAPKHITPGTYLDQGEAFFPNFTNPNQATNLKVIEFDSTTGRAKPFEVAFKNGLWTIPSHHDYPADAKDRLARTAAGVIDITKDDFRSSNASDHKGCRVLDPLDEGAGLAGRGQRVTLKAAGGETLADFIIGAEIEGRPGFRFVRVPDQKRIYACRMDIDLSTRFEDWIETDLLQTAKTKVNRIDINDYYIDEKTLSVKKRDDLIVRKNGGTWSVDGMKNSQQVDTLKISELLTALDELAIVGVRPKPEGLSATLTHIGSSQEISNADLRSLQSRGFYMSRNGQLLSNEGELIARTADGIRYTLRFGEIVYGSGDAISAGNQDSEVGGQQGSGQNRYLFITTEFVEEAYPEPPKPANTEFLNKADSLLTDDDRANEKLQRTWDTWNGSVTRGRESNDELNRRFAQWYYVISSESFDKLRIKRVDLLTARN